MNPLHSIIIPLTLIDITSLSTRGPASKYQIIDPESGETLSGHLEIELSDPMVVRPIHKTG